MKTEPVFALGTCTCSCARLNLRSLRRSAPLRGFLRSYGHTCKHIPLGTVHMHLRMRVCIAQPLPTGSWKQATRSTWREDGGVLHSSALPADEQGGLSSRGASSQHLRGFPELTDSLGPSVSRLQVDPELLHLLSKLSPYICTSVTSLLAGHTSPSASQPLLVLFLRQ